MKNRCEVYKLGLVPYEVAWGLQDSLAKEIAAGDRLPTLLLLEHPHTYTFGRRGQAENLLWDQTELERRGISVHWVDRGGDVTYHGPGQLVGYPLLPLGKVQVNPESRQVRLPQADYIGYLRKLEQVVMLALAELGVGAIRVEGMTEVWVDRSGGSDVAVHPSSSPGVRASIAKVASIGVKVDAHGVSRHGFALNLKPDMSYWEGIIACGLREYDEISLVDLLDPLPTMEGVMGGVVRAFGDVFGYEMIAKRDQLRLSVQAEEG